ncbi:isopropylmalate/homocitrate/citramalate synthase [Acetivibrio clariflavus DSM 19732]|uniref:Isopropylmalate/homocitrate/citramalate synthase n=2 Tax=Acetivibrio clariflavus TaxID=288965 RepID=G8LZM5_ACECE|nr:isopropylmalate/homocitrate/citramalate synthase [Acetivibrio clariflavus DSM 19732]
MRDGVSFMAIPLGKNNAVTVVDRTLSELLSKKYAGKRLETVYFCRILKEIGVDLIEIDTKFLESIPKLPCGVAFLLRINSKEDVMRAFKSNVKYCIFPEKTLQDAETVRKAKNFGIKTTVEVKAEKLSDIDRVKNLSNLDLVDEVRLAGLDSIFDPLWVNKVKKLSKTLNKAINICPQDTYYSATALALEAIMSGINSITVSFLGYGKSTGLAALEEVVTATKVILNTEMKLDLSKLPEAAQYFTLISGIKIPENKPVVGKRIFEYQAGIHADGIEKDPETYEPFDPSMVGLKRELTIGKHSGKRALQRKLEELGIICKLEEAARILNYVREKSIQCKRDLLDEEILDIYKSLQFIR